MYKKLIVFSFIHGKEQDIKEFGATTKVLFRLTDWFVKGNGELIAMESSDSY